MKVLKVKTTELKERYMVVGNYGLPIEPILKFIKFKDNTNCARNTLKFYCNALRLYFEYLEEIKVEFQKITIDSLSTFIN